MGIAQWQAGEGPRDKLLERGEQSLSDAELLAVMLRSGYRNCSALQLAPSRRRQRLKSIGSASSAASSTARTAR